MDEDMEQDQELIEALDALLDATPHASETKITTLLSQRFPKLYDRHRRQIWEGGLERLIEERNSQS
jgi:hypothetical protein